MESKMSVDTAGGQQGVLFSFFPQTWTSKTTKTFIWTCGIQVITQDTNELHSGRQLQLMSFNSHWYDWGEPPCPLAETKTTKQEESQGLTVICIITSHVIDQQAYKNQTRGLVQL